MTSNKNMQVVYRNPASKRIVLQHDKSPELLSLLYESAHTAVEAVELIIDGKSRNINHHITRARDNCDIVRRIIANFPAFIDDFNRYSNG